MSEEKEHKKERKAIEIASKFAKKQNLENDVKKIEKNLPRMKKGPIQEVWGKVQGLSKAVIDPRVAWQEKSIAVGALLYLISPVDLIPDTIPVVGLIDDAGVISSAANTLANVLSKYAVVATQSVHTAVGVGYGIKGGINQREAKKIIETNKQEHNSATERLEIEWKETQNLAQSYGDLQIQVQTDTIPRFLTLLKSINNKFSTEDSKIIESLNGISIPELPAYDAEVKAVQECVQAAGKGLVLGGSRTSLIVVKRTVGLFGKQAFKEIGNATARKAIITEIGAGSMTIGKLFLSTTLVAPVVAGVGFAIGKAGEQTLTKAKEYEKDIRIDIAKIEASQEYLNQIQNRINEMKYVVENLNQQATVQIKRAEKNVVKKNCLKNLFFFVRSLKYQIARFFGKNIKEEKFIIKPDKPQKEQILMLKDLVSVLVELMDYPVLDHEGKLNPMTAEITAKIKESFKIIEGV
ncbi:MAG: YkvA family protein [Cyanobacteria bacterium J06592_8]